MTLFFYPHIPVKSHFYKHGVYKPDEHHVEPNDATLKEGGIKQEDDEGNSLDLRLADRNIAAKVLDNMLDTNVIVNSVKKQFIGKSQNTGKKIESGYKETKDFAAEGTDGIMMDYAPGVELDRINWKGFTPQFTTTNPEYADKTSRAKNSSAWKVPVNPNPNGNKYQYHAPASIKDTNWSEIDSREGHRTIGERLDKIGEKLPGVSFAGWKKERIEARNKKGEDVSVNPGEGNELDIADPDLQRAMSNLNIIDFLMMNPDRHAGNFFINQENGKFKGLTGIDNDVSFGNGTDWTKPHGGNLGALPAAMHIDAKTAAKILGTDDDTLQKKFGEWMRQDEVDSLKERFHQMQAYIGNLQKLDSDNEKLGIDKRYIVNEWNERTAMEQLEETQGQTWSDDKQSTYYQKLAGSLAIKKPNMYRYFT